MNGTSMNRGIRIPLRLGRVALLWTVAVISLGGTWCLAAAPPDNTTTAVAMNQSVSVGAEGQPDSFESSDVAPAESSTTDSALQAAPDGASPASSAEAKPRGSILPPRQRSRTAAADGSSRVIKTRVTPWYQSGLGSLTIVLMVVGVSVWAVRRWVPSARPGGSSAMRVSGRVNLTPKHSIALVHVGRRYLLVGLSGDRMTTLSEVSDPDEVADLAALVNESGTRHHEGFNDILLSEAADFRSTDAPERADTVEVRKARGGVRGLTGLKDLVDRLKSLQKK